MGEEFEMAIAVRVPELGESVANGTIARWLVKEGERVERDQPLVEITTDKVDAEIPAPAAGVVTSLLAAEGETVEIGAVIAQIEESPGAAASPPAAKPAPPAAVPAAEAARATPLAKRAAQEAGVPLASVTGSGPSGRVMKVPRSNSRRTRPSPATMRAASRCGMMRCLASIRQWAMLPAMS